MNTTKTLGQIADETYRNWPKYGKPAWDAAASAVRSAVLERELVDGRRMDGAAIVPCRYLKEEHHQQENSQPKEVDMTDYFSKSENSPTPNAATPTPRTDEAEFHPPKLTDEVASYTYYVDPGFARTLERELTSANKRVEEWKALANEVSAAAWWCENNKASFQHGELGNPDHVHSIVLLGRKNSPACYHGATPTIALEKAKERVARDNEFEPDTRPSGFSAGVDAAIEKLKSEGLHTSASVLTRLRDEQGERPSGSYVQTSYTHPHDKQDEQSIVQRVYEYSDLLDKCDNLKTELEQAKKDKSQATHFESVWKAENATLREQVAQLTEALASYQNIGPVSGLSAAEMITHLRNELAALKSSAASPWIKCSDRMPTKEDEVVLWKDKTGPLLAFHDTVPRNPTHWMPIPPLPAAPVDDDGFEEWWVKECAGGLGPIGDGIPTYEDLKKLAKSFWTAAKKVKP